MNKITLQKQKELIRLRKQGKSIPEIHCQTGIAKTTVQRYVLGVRIPTKFSKILKEKQGSSKLRASSLRKNILERAESMIGTLNSRDQLFLLVGLYWGEGAKKDFSIINSDPLLLQAFARCLEDIGVSKHRLATSLRVHSSISLPRSRRFWSGILNVPEKHFNQVEIIEGRKKGKLPYGMCRIRVRAGIKERLLVQSAIAIVGKKLSKHVVSRS